MICKPVVKIAATMLFLLFVPVPLHAATLDQYGGVTAVNCTNPNGTTYFGMATVSSHKVLCDPSGHPYFARGFFVFDDNSLGNDEAGGNYNSYVTTKYAASPVVYTWDTQEVSRFKSWGFNAVGPFSSTYSLSFWPWTGGPATNPNKVPFIYEEDVCAYSWNNTGSWGSAPVKDLLSPRSSFWTGYVSSGATDYEDPAWSSFVTGILSSSGDSTFQSLVVSNATDKSYLIAVGFCDSDATHGFGAGPDYATQPAGNNDWRLSYLVALDSPVEWASTRQNQIYTDSTVYSKKTFHDQLTGEYANVAALNTAWGSSYTTFGTSGTCRGSHFGSWICPSLSAATSVGTGNGSTLTFSTTLSTTVSPNSLGVFVAGTLKGGDNGSGTIYGPNLSGKINYSTGALSLTFASGNAPGSGAAVTAEYITNGWGIGTGVMDEDGRASHQVWTGHNPVCIDGVGVSSACSSYGTSYASPGMVSDLNTLDVTLATHFGGVTQAALHARLPGTLSAGPTLWGTWTTPPNRYVLQGMAPYVDIMQVGGMGAMTQAELDFIQAHAGDIGIIAGLYNTANADSPFAWPGSSCTHSGTTVTCTLATPQNFSTSSFIDTSCTDSTYNVTLIHPLSSSGSTLTYTASGTPTNPNTTCNVFFDDSNVGGYSTQAARASAVASTLSSMVGKAYTADGIHPYVGALWWQWSDKQGEELSWGIVDTRDNAYNGVETTTATVACSAPIASYGCGGELRSGWGSDDGITPLINANTGIDSALGALTSFVQGQSVTGHATVSGQVKIGP